MKEEAKTREPEKKYYLSEFSYHDGEYEITFNIIDVDFLRQTITVTISRLINLLRGFPASMP